MKYKVIILLIDNIKRLMLQILDVDVFVRDDQKSLSNHCPN